MLSLAVLAGATWTGCGADAKPPTVHGRIPEVVETESRPAATVEAAAGREGQPDARLELLGFASAFSRALNDSHASPPPSNSYSHETGYDAAHLAEPRVSLESTADYAALASTDCSGWVSFVVDTVSPLHSAVLQSQRMRPEYNRRYDDGFTLEEGVRGWSRAFVLTNFFRSGHADSVGFLPVVRHSGLQRGDLVAYALGRYTDPADAGLPKPPDTGHTFFVAGAPHVVDPDTADYDGGGTLSRDAVRVVAVPIVDSSSVPHFAPDSRETAAGGYALPKYVPTSEAKAGGVGEGVAWFALDAHDHVVQRRLGPEEPFGDVVIAAARPTLHIRLGPEVLDSRGHLVVDAFDDAPHEYAGVPYGDVPVELTGEGGIRLVDGRLVLSGDSRFAGGVTVKSGELVVRGPRALGGGDVELHGGVLQLQAQALADDAVLHLSESLADGSVVLDFEGEDVARGLQLGEALHRCGVFGAPASGAEHTDRRFAGRGRLRLVGDCGEGT